MVIQSFVLVLFICKHLSHFNFIFKSKFLLIIFFTAKNMQKIVKFISNFVKESYFVLHSSRVLWPCIKKVVLSMTFCGVIYCVKARSYSF